MTVKRRRKLERIVAARTSEQRLVLRARIVLAAADGRANAAIAAELGCSVPTVRTWRERFARRGVPGIFDRPRCGRPPVYGPSARLAVVATATTVPPIGQTVWSHATLAAHLRERGLPVSPATVGRVLNEAEVRPHRVRGWLRRADDPTFWTRAGQVCRLYLDPPAGTVLVSIDEKTGIQAKTRKYPEIPLRPGRAARREFEYVRHGTVSIIAAMDVATGQVLTQRIGRNTSAAFTAFLTTLDKHLDPALRIHLILDNGSSHTARATRAWLAAHPRFSVTYTPKARLLAEHDRTVVRCPDPPAATPRRLQLPRGPRNPHHRVHDPPQRDSPALPVELRRRHRTRPLPRTPPHHNRPHPSCLTSHTVTNTGERSL